MFSASDDQPRPAWVGVIEQSSQEPFTKTKVGNLGAIAKFDVDVDVVARIVEAKPLGVIERETEVTGHPQLLGRGEGHRLPGGGHHGAAGVGYRLDTKEAMVLIVIKPVLAVQFRDELFEVASQGRCKSGLT